MGLPYTFATLNLTAYSKDAQGNYVIPASALDDNFNYVLARTWVGTTAPTDTTKYCFWLDTSVSPNIFKVWDGTGWVNSYAGVIVRKNTGSNIGQRPRLNFIEGCSLTITDDPVDNEIDITINGITVRKNTGSNVGTRPRLNFIEGSGTTLTITDDAVDNEVDITIKAGFDPTVSSVFYEEFDSIYIPASIIYAGNVWEIINSNVTVSGAERGGVIYFVGNGTNLPSLRPIGSNTSFPYVSSKNPTVIVREAQYGADTSVTRFFGLGNNDLNATLTDGIYFRHIGGGNYIGVCRKASVETTLNTGVAAANGTFHTLKFVVNGTTSVEFFVDGVSKGTITTNIPTANLYFSCADDSSSTSYGMYLNYVYISQDR